MKIGPLDKIVTLRRLTQVQTASGSLTSTWQDVAQLWAQVTYGSSNQSLEADQMVDTGIVTFRMRYYPLHKADILVYNDLEHELVGIPEIIGRKVQIIAKAKVKQ